MKRFMPRPEGGSETGSGPFGPAETKVSVGACALRIGAFCRSASANPISIKRQMRGALGLARSRQGCIVHAYIDSGVSGLGPPGPEFRRALADADRNVLDVLFGEDAARISRDEARVIDAVRRLNRAGVRIETLRGELHEADAPVVAVHARPSTLRNLRRCS